MSLTTAELGSVIGPTRDVTDHLELRVARIRLARKLEHERQSHWAIAPDFKLLDAIEPTPLLSYTTPSSTEAVWNASDFSPSIDGLVWLTAGDGNLGVRCLGTEAIAAEVLVLVIRGLIPPYASEDPDMVGITFWTMGRHGPHMRRRDLDADSWEAIEENYPEPTRHKITRMVDSFQPGRGGQLVLWHGEPGTGKTTALRMLAREWSKWAEVHYIVDPDKFFGQASYMMEVFLADIDDVAQPVTDGESTEEPERPQWRVLILEDCGELLQPDAREEVGQALSRLLNACDGMIGRGLRVLLLITTNEEIGKLHEAVARPGRCAALVKFDTFATDEANAWLQAHGSDSAVIGKRQTLADLYGMVEHFDTTAQEQAVGFA